MANWYGTSRSNYFAVKDLEAFKAALKPFELEIVTSDRHEGLVAVLAETDDGGFPSYYVDEDDGDLVDVDIVALITEHLADGHVCVLQSVGAEKLRYLTGWAVAFNNKGESIEVNIDNVITQAEAQGLGTVTAVLY